MAPTAAAIICLPSPQAPRRSGLSDRRSSSLVPGVQYAQAGFGCLKAAVSGKGPQPQYHGVSTVGDVYCRFCVQPNRIMHPPSNLPCFSQTRDAPTPVRAFAASQRDLLHKNGSAVAPPRVGDGDSLGIAATPRILERASREFAASHGVRRWIGRCATDDYSSWAIDCLAVPTMLATSEAFGLQSICQNVFK